MFQKDVHLLRPVHTKRLCSAQLVVCFLSYPVENRLKISHAKFQEKLCTIGKSGPMLCFGTKISVPAV